MTTATPAPTMAPVDATGTATDGMNGMNGTSTTAPAATATTGDTTGMRTAPAAAATTSPPANPPSGQSTAPATSPAGSPNADNSANNSGSTRGLTAGDQSNAPDDIKITATIRKAIMADKTLSFMAKNVKIITISGKVTLKGPVKSDQERSVIESAAKRVAGDAQVDNQIEVKK